MSSSSELQELSVSAAAGCSSLQGRVPLKLLGRDTDSQTFREHQGGDTAERADNKIKLYRLSHYVQSRTQKIILNRETLHQILLNLSMVGFFLPPKIRDERDVN